MAVIAALASAALFLPGLSGPFLLDDGGNIARLQNVEPTWASIYEHAFANRSGPLLRPVANLTFIGNLLTAGPFPFPFKLTNLAIHAATSLLLFGFARVIARLIRPDARPAEHTAIAMLAMLVWSVHPIQVSTVLYAVQRMAQLSAQFSVAAVLCVLTGLVRIRPSASVTFLAVAGFCFFTVLALLSKENGILTPLELASVLLCAPAAFRRALKEQHRQLLRFVLALAAITLAATIVAMIARPSLMPSFDHRGFTMFERLLTETKVLWVYMADIALPVPARLGLFRDDISIASPSALADWLPALALAGLIVLIGRLPERYGAARFGFFWFMTCHLLEAGPVPLELAFEHRNYLALFGPSYFVADAVYSIWRHSRVTGALLGTTCLCALAVLTLTRSNAWSDIETFAAAEVSAHPGSPRAQLLMILVEHASGNRQAALSRLEAARKNEAPFDLYAVELDFACHDPTFSPNWGKILQSAEAASLNSSVLGSLHEITVRVVSGKCAGITPGRLDQFLSEVFSRSQLDGPRQFILALRGTLRERSSPVDAREFFRRAVAVDPSNRDAWERLALFETAQGNTDLALAAITAASDGLSHWSPRYYHYRSLRERALERSTQGQQ